jgi:outer membrane protein assembly factor BamE
VLIAGCAADSSVSKYVPNIVTPYRMDIQQGNFVTQDMVDKLQKGQTRDQVRFILGTPLLTDVFHANRWDYIFRSSKGWNDPEKHKLTVMFDAGPDGKLAGWESDVPPPKSAEVVEDKPGFFGGMFGGKSAAPKPAAPAAAGTPDAAAPPAAAAVAPAPAPAPAPASAPAPAPATKPADLPNLSSSPSSSADKDAEKKPSLLRRMFGWVPGVSTEDAAAGAARAASPENTPLPKPTIADPPKVAPAEPSPATGTVSVGPAIQESTTPPPAPTPAPPPAPAAAPAPGPAPAPVPEAMPSTAQATLAAGGVTPVTLTAQAATAPASSPASSAQAVLTPDGVIASVERWRAAWQAKDLTRYLASYAPDFRAPGNLSRAKWEALRRDRLTKPSFIVVKVIDPQVTLGKDDVAVAVFVQEYESNLLKESGRKTLRMARYGSDWLILEEMAK